MTHKDQITANSPAMWAIEETIRRMVRVTARKAVESLLPLDEANDDLIQSCIRSQLDEQPKMLAHWIGGGADNGRYEILGRPWISLDGTEWIDSRTGDLLDTEEFYLTQITLFGGPMDGEVIG